MGFNKDIVILDGARTPVGTFGGVFRKITATQLGVHAGQAAMERAGVTPQDVDNVVLGNVLQTSTDAVYIARHVGLECGIPRDVPAFTRVGPGSRSCGRERSAKR